MPTSNKPLWQKLNEERTQYEWKHKAIDNGNTILIYSEMFGAIAKIDAVKAAEEHKANATYTALAVNNLHVLAEALQEIILCEERGRAKGEPRIPEAWYNQAKEALTNIS